MKILFVSIPFHAKGGVDIYTSELIHELRKTCEIKAVVSERIRAKKQHLNTIPTCVFPRSYNPDAFQRYPIYHHYSVHHPSVEHGFLSTVRAFEPDLIHFQHLLGLPISLLAFTEKIQLPAIVNIHDFWLLCPRIHFYHADGSICEGSKQGQNCSGCVRKNLGFKEHLKSLMQLTFSTCRPTRQFFENRYHYAINSLNHARAISVPSEFVKSKCISEGVDAQKISVLPLPVHPGKVGYARATHKRMQFGYVGALRRHKGIQDLIRAFLEVNGDRADLHVYGGGSMAWLRKYLKVRSNTSIFFHGFFNYNQIDLIYQNLDALIVPSRCYETYSFVMREALLRGIPVIAPRHSVFKDIIADEKNGLLYEPLDYTSLSKKLESLLSRKIVFDNNMIGGFMAPTPAEHAVQILELYWKFKKK